MKVAVYTICKNELNNIPRWLEAVQEADEIVVLDTGSTDGSWELLQQSGIKCHQSIITPWRFDVARNEALQLVSADCDICVPLDMDCFPKVGFTNIIKSAWSTDLGILEFGVTYPNTTKLGRQCAHTRKNAYWVYPVYEQVRAIGNKKIISEVLLHHDHKFKALHKSYLPLIDLAIAENPTSTYCKEAKQQILKLINKGEELQDV